MAAVDLLGRPPPRKFRSVALRSSRMFSAVSVEPQALRGISIRHELPELDLPYYRLGQARENVGTTSSALSTLHTPTICRLPRYDA